MIYEKKSEVAWMALRTLRSTLAMPKKDITSKYEFVLLELLGDSSNKNSYNLYNTAGLSWN